MDRVQKPFQSSYQPNCDIQICPLFLDIYYVSNVKNWKTSINICNFISYQKISLFSTRNIELGPNSKVYCMFSDFFSNYSSTSVARVPYKSGLWIWFTNVSRVQFYYESVVLYHSTRVLSFHGYRILISCNVWYCSPNKYAFHININCVLALMIMSSLDLS